MKILFLNWKDSHHPLAGGAEEFTVNLLSRFAAMGHEVTWFTSMYDIARRSSVEGGIHYIRSGNIYSVHAHAKRYLSTLAPSERPDIVVDEVNTRPFDPSKSLPPGIPVVNLIHQLAREIWWTEVPFPLALVGRYWLEKRWLRAISTHPTITISASTRQDLLALGFRNVKIVHVALTEIPASLELSKPEPPHLLFVGRLTRGKKARDAIEAFVALRKRVDCLMTVAGDGPLLGELTRRYGDVAHFTGHVDNETKKRLFRDASVLLVPGTREGWGIVVLEAQSYGAIPVVYDVPGLRDAVDFGRSGVLVPGVSPMSMAQAVGDLLLDQARRTQLAQEGWKWCQQFTYEVATREFLRYLTDPEFLGS